MYSTYFFVIILIYHLNIGLTQDLPITTITKSSPLPDSDCFCSYDPVINLLSCSPSLQESSSFSLFFQNQSLINLTLDDCTFSNNRLSLPSINGKTIDHLQLHDINHQDYLVFDSTSFSSFPINQLYITYSSIQPITILLFSSDTFTSSPINFSLRKLHIDSCYLLTLNKPFSRLYFLESLTLVNIHQFSWYDFQQQIIYLSELRSVTIGENILSTTNDIFNSISCNQLPLQWTFTYRLIQTCSCQFFTFLRSLRRIGNLYKCPNSDRTIDFIDDICQLNGKEYKIYNQSNSFCNRCLSKQCSNGSLCGEAYDSEATCLLLSRCDYETIRNRIPLTAYTKPYLFQESQEYLNINASASLEVTGFNNVAAILIDSNRNITENSPNDVQMFHQTFSEMLNRPWSSSIYTAASSTPTVWQDLILSLDESMKNFNDTNTKFEFQSKPISTFSQPFQSDTILNWKITNDNKITMNSSSIDGNTTTRVVLKLNNTQSCINCTSRFSITSLKSPKLFYNTSRTPKYDVISIISSNPNQHVTFYFDQKISENDSSNSSTNTSNSFYDQLDLMTSEGFCMYLNTTSMIWQRDGCITNHKLSNSTSVVCTCEHLTMFTVFFSLTCATPSKALSILSWIGCILSIVGLSVTLITFILISQCRRTKNSTDGISSSHSSSSQELRRRIMSKPRRLSMVKSMLFILCILLILMNILILILTFIKSTQNLSCSILSASLYYFTLTAFLWKFLFAFQQSLFITNIFQPYWSDRTLFLIYLSLAFSLPICPLIIMFIKYPNFTFISSTCNYCWLTREFLFYGLIIPILILLCLIFTFYLYTMIHLCLRNRQQADLRSTKSNHSRHIQNFKIGLFFAIIMGLSWILGFLVLIPNSSIQLFGNILFCIINSLQGFAFSIMVFCMLERKSFRKCCCFWKYQQNSKKAIIHSESLHPQQLEITSNEEKIKSSYTSTTSNGEFDNNKNKILPTKDEEEKYVYSTLPI